MLRPPLTLDLGAGPKPCLGGWDTTLRVSGQSELPAQLWPWAAWLQWVSLPAGGSELCRADSHDRDLHLSKGGGFSLESSPLTFKGVKIQ